MIDVNINFENLKIGIRLELKFSCYSKSNFWGISTEYFYIFILLIYLIIRKICTVYSIYLLF